jgi:amino acid adenylation domain-containing protein
MLDAESTESEGEMNLPPSASRGDDPACVMYTSGSTGAPKGVAVTHRGIARLVCATDYLQLRGGDTVAHLSNPAFDATAFELWGALLNGARVAIIARDVVMSPAMLADALDRNEATALLLTTALFDRVAQDAPHALRGRQVLFGGEAATPRCVRSALDEGHPARLVHLYGPTEATTIATWHEVRAVDHDAVTVPIGRPIANTTVHLLDAHGAPVPPGVAGEIFIGGPGVALGYVGQPALTAERFVADPFDAPAGARLYRTGDLARDRGDGVLEFVGRRDRQVKLRGHRIELAEIETALVRLHGVRDAAVVMHGEASDTRRLAAYVVPVPDAVLAPEDLWRGLRRTLPEYMVPAGIVLLAALPLTRNGKVDHAALPDPDVMARQRNLLQASPSDPLEYAIFMIWRAHLGHANFGVCESFFDVGGHSLLAARMIDAIESACGVDVPLVTLFEAPTIEALAAAIRGTDRAQGAISSVVNPKGTRPPFFFLHGDFNGGGFYSRRLAQALGTDQPFYALHPHGIGGERIPDSIEAMADERLHALREVRPHGPYFLGGYCNGALVALEMARRLVAAQEEVPVVVVIDAAAPGMPTTSSRGLDSLDARYQGVMAGYAPPPYSGRIAVLHSDAMSDPRTREAWVPFARQVEFHPIPGDHFAAITTNAVATAGQMRACLQRALP